MHFDHVPCRRRVAPSLGGKLSVGCVILVLFLLDFGGELEEAVELVVLVGGKGLLDLSFVAYVILIILPRCMRLFPLCRRLLVIKRLKL